MFCVLLVTIKSRSVDDSVAIRAGILIIWVKFKVLNKVLILFALRRRPLSEESWVVYNASQVKFHGNSAA